MKKLSLEFIAFLQAVGIVVYCILIGTLMIHGDTVFGPHPTFIGPAVFLALFIVSAVICTLIFFYYPFILFWEQKQTKKALHLVLCSTAWLFSLVVAGLISFAWLNRPV